MLQRVSLFALIVFLFATIESGFAQSKAPLGTQEIRGAKRIQFQNRSLRRASDAVVQENTDIGKSLAQQLGAESTQTASQKGLKIQRIQPGEDKKFGGDILSIEAGQSFDHINSISRILAAYIESSFQYSEANAETLALYVLYYNASHRKDLNFFKVRYTADLVSQLDADRVGIDTSYKNWPGKTQIVIPITGNILKDGGKDITTDELEKDVNKTVTTKEKDPDTKKKMEEEASKMSTLQTTKIQEEKKLVEEKKSEVAKVEEGLKKKETDLQKKSEEAAKLLQDLQKDPVKNATKIEETKQVIQQVEEEKKQVTEQKQQVAQTKEDLEKKSEDLAKKEEQRTGATTQTSPTTTEEQKTKDPVKELTKELAEVREELKKKEEKSENVIDNKIVFMKFIKYDTDGHYSNELWALDPVKDDALFKSPFTNICSKEFLEIPGQGILVLGYEGAKVDDRKHKLTYLDTKTLVLKKQSDASDVFWRTPMVYTDEKIYVIERFENNYHLTRFNPDLTVDIRSSAPVEENSEVTFFKDKIYITGKGKGEGKTTIKVFQRADLKHLKTIAP